MQLITRVNDEDKIEIISDQKTVGGNDLVIITTPSGYFRIIARGEGAPLKISEDLFTSKRHAEEALRKYVAEISPQVRKKQIHLEAIERRKRKANGEGPTE